MQAFTALADDTRLAIVEELGKGERAVGDLVELVRLRQPTVSQHLKVLKEAGLVRVRPVAQRRLYSLDPRGFEVIELWLERHRRTWAKRLDDLEAHMDAAPERSGGDEKDRRPIRARGGSSGDGRHRRDHEVLHGHVQPALEAQC